MYGFLTLVLLASAAAAQDVRVDATVNAERIGIEDVLELTISISGGANFGFISMSASRPRHTCASRASTLQATFTFS